MTKQEEIREGIINILEPYAFSGTITSSDGYYFFCDKADDVITAILSYLHSQGVVIKVERELPPNPYIGMDDFAFIYQAAQKDMAGYVAVVPLIKEEK